MERKRVTKNDKKNDRQVYSQKHVRILLKQIEASKLKRVDGSLHAADRALLPDGRVRLHGKTNVLIPGNNR